MTTFIDTSGLLALGNPDDANHGNAARAWVGLMRRSDTLVTSNYVVLETVALLQRRYGVGAVRRLRDDILPVLEVEWIDREAHATAMSAVIAGGRQ